MDLPSKFIENIRALIPEESEAFIKAMAEEPAVSIKLNKRKTPVGGEEYLYTEGQPVKWCNSGKYLSERPKFTLNPLMHCGVFYVQDASSMIYETITEKLAEACDKSKPLLALDLCAAPGGKTTSIINALPDGSTVVANEFVAQRAVILRENLSKWGYHDVIVTNSPTDRFTLTGEIFDIVAVDAPCSGEGMMRKDPKAVEQWSESLIRQCRRLQEEIVTNAAGALKNGGFLIYSTCTFNHIENEEMAEFIVEKLGLTPFSLDFPEEWNIHRGVGTDIPCYRFMPHITKGEGLFVAVFRKEDSDDASPRLKEPGKNRRTDKSEPLTDLKDWTTGDNRLTRIKDTVYAASPALDALRRRLEEKVRILSAGVPVAESKGKNWSPRVELALSDIYNRNKFPTIEADEETALKYLRAEALILPPETDRNFVCMTFKGVPLGFVKNIGNRANNLYPSEWRIRNL